MAYRKVDSLTRAELLAEASSLGIDVAGQDDANIRALLKAELEKRWLAENLPAIEHNNRWIAQNGLPGQDIRAWR